MNPVGYKPIHNQQSLLPSPYNAVLFSGRLDRDSGQWRAKLKERIQDLSDRYSEQLRTGIREAVQAPLIALQRIVI